MRGTFVALLACALLAGCGSTASDEMAAPSAPEPVPPVEATPPPEAADRPPAPPISGESLDGEMIALADLRGRPVLVNVWSSW
jgi:hypothetical protein